MQTDVLIVGGGLSGCALALALAQRAPGLSVTMVEMRATEYGSAHYDERHLGLAEASVTALTKLGVWPRISEAVGEIAAIHVSSAGEFGHAVLRAAEQGVPRFGLTCPARALGEALDAAVAQLPGLKLLRPATLVSIEAEEQLHRVSLEMQGAVVQIDARLLVGADGSHSRVRELAGIGHHSEDTWQVAIVSNISCERAHAGMAFERFTRDGPVALLPLPGGRCGAVWTQSAAAAEHCLALDDDAFLAGLQQAFGYRLGRLTRVGRRVRHALLRIRSTHTTAPRMALVGNAAQTLHPIAAQGFNLGLRDALGLADALSGTDDPGAVAVLQAFAAARLQDRQRTRQFSEGLLGLTCNPVLGPLRSLGLLALDALPPLRAGLVHFGMGYGRA